MASKIIKRLGLVNYISGAGQTKKGVCHSPLILSERLQKEHKNIKIKNYNIFHGFDNQPFLIEKNKQILNDNFDLSQNIKKSFQENEKTLVLGGDHSLGLGSVAASLEDNKDTHVIWIDAHADINTPEKSESKNFHGMPLSFICNLTEEKLPWLKNYLSPQNLTYLGLRDVDDFETETLKKYNITNYNAKETISNLPDILDEISKKINDKPVHLSVDVDAFDPSLIFSTGTPVNDGLELEHFYKIVNMINQSTDKNKIMDLAELNLKIGDKNQQNISLKNSLNIINYWLFSCHK